MHTKRHVIEQVLHLSRRNIYELLYLRIVLELPNSQHPLEMDIDDLSRFPERVEGSYRDEWLAFIKRQLYRRAFKIKGLTAKENLQQFVLSLIESDRIRIQQTYEQYKTHLERAQAMTESGSVEIFQSPLHQWLAVAIK